MKRRDSVLLLGFPLLQGDLEVTVKSMTIRYLRRWNVFRTLFHFVLDEIGQHDNHLALLLPDHSPKVGNGRLYWRLTRDVILCGVLRPLEEKKWSVFKSHPSELRDFIQIISIIISRLYNYFHFLAVKLNPTKHH